MATPTVTQVLTIFAAVLAVTSLVLTTLFVHDRRQRWPGLLISAGLICLLVEPMFRDSAIGIAIMVVAFVTTIASGMLSIRALRAPSN